MRNVEILSIKEFDQILPSLKWNLSVETTVLLILWWHKDDNVQMSHCCSGLFHQQSQDASHFGLLLQCLNKADYLDVIVLLWGQEKKQRDKNRYADGNCFTFLYANSKLLGLLIILLISNCIFETVSKIFKCE